MANRFFSIHVGQLVACGERRYKITHILSTNAVLGKDIDTEEAVQLKVDVLQPISDVSAEEDKTSCDIGDYSEEEWSVARKRLAAIFSFINDPESTRKIASEAAKVAGISISTIYRWRDDYLKSGHLSALVPEKRGRKQGTVLLREEQEAVVKAVIEEVFLTRQRHTPQYVIEEVARRCRTANIKSPHPNTIRHRIAGLKTSEVLRKRGYSEMARNLYRPIESEFPGADSPLAVVQVDHTEADIILVEETTRLPIGRPWMTLAIDVNTRVVVGIYVTFEHPSAVSVGMCLSNAILPKGEYLAELDVPGDWPVWGKMGVVHVDNAKEFRGLMLQRACQDYGMDLQMRPVKVPHYGGHIERLMGTMANEIRNLPGATFSSPAKRKGYDSVATAAMTLREFEQHLADFIVNVYHRRVHSELDTTPLAKWEQGIVGDGTSLGTGLPALPEDPRKVRLDFMPFLERTVQPYGLLIDEISYYSEILNPWINASDPLHSRQKRKFTIRRDPRDISKVFFYDPEARQYYEIPYRNMGHPPMSLWELREVRRKLKEEGASQVDETAIFESLDRMRMRVAEAKLKSKKARRSITRNPESRDSLNTRKIVGSIASIGESSVSGSTVDDIFSEPMKPFDDIVVK